MKAQFSVSYVHMIASAAGCSIKYHLTDYDGVDITITSSSEYQKFYSPQIEVQLKCTAQRELLKPGAMTWTLEADRFRLLTNPKSYIQRFLGVLLVPDDPLAWISQDESRLLAHSCMYWARATDLGTIPDGQGSKTVHLPRSNVFNVEQLLAIMKSIGEGDA